MNKKILKNYSYLGFGFPVELHDVEMIKIEGKWVPKLDLRKISHAVVKSLVLQKTKLTGNQIRFIRSYFSMSLRDFSKVVNESHAAVKKWEDFLDAPTSMDINIEVMLRLYLYKRTMEKTGLKKQGFYERYLKLTEIFYQHKDLP